MNHFKRHFEREFAWAICGEKRAWHLVTKWRRVTCKRCLALKGKR